VKQSICLLQAVRRYRALVAHALIVISSAKDAQKDTTALQTSQAVAVSN